MDVSLLLLLKASSYKIKHFNKLGAYLGHMLLDIGKHAVLPPRGMGFGPNLLQLSL